MLFRWNGDDKWGDIFNTTPNNTDMWPLCKAGCCYNGQPSWSPMVGGEFTPSMKQVMITSKFTLQESVIQASGIFVKQVVFLTVNHCGPLPLRELHSTDETIVWRDPGGSWACLRPVAEYEWIHPAWNSNTDIMVWHLWAAVHSTGKTWYGCGETDGDRGWNILPGY